MPYPPRKHPPLPSFPPEYEERLAQVRLRYFKDQRLVLAQPELYKGFTIRKVVKITPIWVGHGDWPQYQWWTMPANKHHFTHFTIIDPNGRRVGSYLTLARAKARVRLLIEHFPWIYDG